MIIEYTDSHDHPTVAGWLVDERPWVIGPECTLAGAAWRVPGGWNHCWRLRNLRSGRLMASNDEPCTLRRCRFERINGNGRRYRGHTGVARVELMSRVNVLALFY